MWFDQEGQRARRERWYELTRAEARRHFNEDGTGKIPQMEPPYREPVWILPALYRGEKGDVALANRIVAHYVDPAKVNTANAREKTGREFGIFQSNSFAHCLHAFRHLLTSEAEEVMVWHATELFKTFKGSAQPDFKFHGANDNMPMMATKGLILGGESLDDEAAQRYGLWNLHQFRNLLSRSAWASEFNSSTYSAVTLSNAAQIAHYSTSEAVRKLALDIEHRLWAEVILHYHPGTKMQSGPQSRAYCVDYAGHTHALQILMWLAFGDLYGRDVVKSFFEPDGVEVTHFEGCHFQSICEYCDMMDGELHPPAELAELMKTRAYPAVHRGRSEGMGSFDGMSVAYHTETYMEEDFSLGTCDHPMCGGEQTSCLHVTYKRAPSVAGVQDASTVFYKYLTDNVDVGALDASVDGVHKGERYIPSKGWCYAIQKKNVGVLLCEPNLKSAPPETDTLKLLLCFPAHYGKISKSVIGKGMVANGASGDSKEPVPVSVEAGEVYLHVQPLLPTNLPRRSALRFSAKNNYEFLELVNYEGPIRSFTRKELSMALNGFVVTVDSKSRWRSLNEFHKAKSDCLVTDYFMSGHRFFRLLRSDAVIEVVMTTDPIGVQTEAVDGRQVPRPVFESNQLDVSKLPFMSGEVVPSFPFFPWKDSLDICWYPENSWMIGSRGVPGEANYNNRKEKMI